MNQASEEVNDVGDVVEAILEKKRADGRDYTFAQRTERETVYHDQDHNALIFAAMKDPSGCYLLELEETKGEKDACSFSIYTLNGDGSGKPPTRSVLGTFDSEGDNKNKADASKLFRRFRDAVNIRAELERYEKETL